MFTDTFMGSKSQQVQVQDCLGSAVTKACPEAGALRSCCAVSTHSLVGDKHLPSTYCRPLRVATEVFPTGASRRWLRGAGSLIGKRRYR